MPFAMTWMNLEGITLSEISQTEKDKYHMTSLTHRIQKLANKKPKFIDIENRLVVARGGDGRYG